VPYPPDLVDPMRSELSQLGFQELRTAEEAAEALGDRTGTVLLVVNSVCGCAAGNARPGVALALEEGARPDRLLTVFAGQDLEATERARSHLPGYAPSSPSIALLRDGEVVTMLERKDIEGRTPVEVGADLRGAFQRYCSPQPR